VIEEEIVNANNRQQAYEEEMQRQICGLLPPLVKFFTD
jgi:hypothetical protein